MAHQVTFNLPTRDLGKSDIHFTVKVDGAIFGKLEVSKGAVGWYPKDTTYGHKMSWRALDAEMQRYPRSERRKPR
jgi:hypothetical protein